MKSQISRNADGNHIAADPNELHQLLTPEQVARLLNVSVRFVREHASELGAIRLGGGKHRAGRLRFREIGLRRFIAENSLQKVGRER